MSGSDQTNTRPNAKNMLRSIARVNANKGSAVLHLSCGSDLARVFIQAGEVVHVDGVKGLFVRDLENPVGRLDHDIGALIGSGVPANEAMNRAAMAIGRFLVENGTNSDCDWGLKGGKSSPDSAIHLPIGLEKMLIDACVAHLAKHTSDDTLDEFVDGVLTVCDNSITPSALPSLSFRAYRSIASGAKSLKDVLAKLSTSAVGPVEAKRAVDLLFIFGLIELTEKVETPLVEPLPREVGKVETSAPSGDSAGWTVESLEAIERQFARQHPLQIFGLASDGAASGITPYDVRSAFRKIAADFHPDRFSGAADEVKESAERVFSFLNHARSKIESQEDIDRAIQRFLPKKSSSGVVTEIDRTKAKGLVRNAEARMRHGKWDEARDCLLLAIAQSPENKGYQILEIFCRGVMKSLPYIEAAALIERVETDSVRQHADKYYRSGWLYKLSGDHKKASIRFNKALAHDPNHVDSSRELRMLGKRSAAEASTRRREQTKIPFARFFKKK